MSEKQAFQVEHKGFIATGYWGDSADGRVVVTREGKPFKEFAYPAYRIFNIAAHWEDIVEAALVPNGAGELGEANARLIAAAPDLLEALRWMRSCFDEHGELRETYDDQCSVSLEKADAAIAKAEGK